MMMVGVDAVGLKDEADRKPTDLLGKLVKLSVCNKYFTKCKYYNIPFSNYDVWVRIRFLILFRNC